MTLTTSARFKGVFPVVPTTFTESGELDLPSQKRCVDFMIDAGSNGLCILANFSEQFVLSDTEREVLTKLDTMLEGAFARVLAFAERHQLPHRTAAQALAIKTVADAKAQRGMFP